MKNLLIALSIITISACSSTATTPTPKDELTTTGHGATKGASYNAAQEQAEDFCDRWNAAPSIISKITNYQGGLEEDTNTAVNVAIDVAKAANQWIAGLGNSDAYETTLKYKCY